MIAVRYFSPTVWKLWLSRCLTHMGTPMIGASAGSCMVSRADSGTEASESSGRSSRPQLRQGERQACAARRNHVLLLSREGLLGGLAPVLCGFRRRGLLDAALQAAGIGRELGVSHREQIGVEAAIVLDGADRVDRETQPD